MSRTGTHRTLQSAGIACAVLMAAVTLYLNRDFYHDDAYITLRYARNWVRGAGVVWNPGEHVQGYTNFLHLLIVSFLGMLGIDLVRASRILGVAALAGLSWVLIRFGTIGGDKAQAPLWHLPAVLVLTSAPMVVWSIGGLGGTLFSLVVTGGCLLFLQAEGSGSPRHYGASGLLLGLGFLTRPDGAVFVAVSFFWLCLKAWKKGSKTHRPTVIAYGLGVAAAVVPYLVWQLYYYGDFVPNTFYTKMEIPLRLRIATGAHYAAHYALCPPFLPILALVTLVGALLKHAWNGKLTYLTVSAAAYSAFIVIAGGDHMQAFRLILPLIPLAGLILAMVLSPAVASKGGRTVGLITLAVLGVASLQLFDKTVSPRREDRASYVGTIVGKYIAQAWPRGSLVALNTAGSTAYYAENLRFVDMLGLNDATIAKRKIDKIELPWQTVPGHFKGYGEYVLSRRPDYVIVGPSYGTETSEPWFLSDLELDQLPQFGREYEVFRVDLDRAGRRVTDRGELTFTYYKRRGPENLFVPGRP